MVNSVDFDRSTPQGASVDGWTDDVILLASKNTSKKINAVLQRKRDLSAAYGRETAAGKTVEWAGAKLNRLMRKPTMWLCA